MSFKDLKQVEDDLRSRDKVNFTLIILSIIISIGLIIAMAYVTQYDREWEKWHIQEFTV
jgi:hypothetical protein